jgi:hypothetical protein
MEFFSTGKNGGQAARKEFLGEKTFSQSVFRRENRRSYSNRRGELHNFSACGKVVHAVCKGRIAYVHFSLAHTSPIGDNPALS